MKRRFIKINKLVVGGAIVAAISLVASVSFFAPKVSMAAVTADINSDGKVDVIDLSILLSNYAKTAAQSSNPAADVNASGIIDITDLSILLTNFGHASNSLTITGVTNGATVSGSAASLGASTGGAAVAKVELYLDGALLRTEAAAPYCFGSELGAACGPWDSTAVANGTHSVFAKSYDAGNVLLATAATVTFTVNNSSGGGTGDPAGTGSGTHYYVDAATGNDASAGTSSGTAWKTIAKINGRTFAAGDVVHMNGTFSGTIDDNGNGTSNAPILYTGTGSLGGKAGLTGITLSASQNIIFRNLDLSNPGTMAIRTPYNGGGLVQYIKFDAVKVHDSKIGVYIGGTNHKDITFTNSDITNITEDGILLDDPAGDRFSYIGGYIRNTGQVRPGDGHGVHGVYSSGGTSHLYAGISFSNNLNGDALSLRRGGMNVRDCTFTGPNEEHIGFYNEDEAGGVNEYTGSPSTGLVTRIYRNKFNGGILWHGDNNDAGINNPGNSWDIFNNTFNGTNVALYSTQSSYYTKYIRNNVFVGGNLQTPTMASGKTLIIDHNGFSGLTAKGTNALTSSPALDGSMNVTAAAYVNAGVAAISPATTLSGTYPGAPLGYVGAAPDIGATER